MTQPARPNHAPPPLAAKPPSRMSLAAVTSGRVERPVRIVFYSVEGLGKSTFAASAPAPVFLGTEDGTAQLDVKRLPDPRTWQEVLDAVAILTDGEHAYRTLVLDTADWIEPLVWAHVCEAAGKKSIEDLPYGKGYTAALDHWRVLLSRLDALREKRRMHVIVLAHSWVRTFKSPDSDDFDRYEMKVHAKAGGLLKEWADCVFFGSYETLTRDANNGKAKGVSTGKRLVHTQRTAAWDAKNRYDLPESFELPRDEGWATFVAAAKEAREARGAVNNNETTTKEVSQ
jgi:hypothetical protein